MGAVRPDIKTIEKTLKTNLADYEVHGGMVRYWVSMEDAKHLLRYIKQLEAENKQLREYRKLLTNRHVYTGNTITVYDDDGVTEFARYTVGEWGRKEAEMSRVLPGEPDERPE